MQYIVQATYISGNKYALADLPFPSVSFPLSAPSCGLIPDPSLIKDLKV